MRTLYITLVVLALMLVVLPQHALLAVSPSSPIYTHFVYMFGHANFVHWAVNAWCLLMVHRQFRIHRLLASWLGSVGLSFVYYPPLPVLGASVIISFFMGTTAPWLYSCKRLAFWQMFILLCIGCLLPHIAGFYHLILFTLGFLYAKVEQLVRQSQKLNI